MGEKTPPPSRGVPVELDRVRYLRYTLGTLRKIRQEFGQEQLAAGVSEEKLAKVLWYGLVGDDPDLKQEDVENLIDLEHLPVVVKAMRTAMGQKGVEISSPSPQPAETGPEAPAGQ